MAGFKVPSDIQLPTYKSPYGPNDRTSRPIRHIERVTRNTRANQDQTRYHYQPQVAGITFKQLAQFGLKTSYFGVVGLFAVVYFASGIPRVKKDILQKLPVIGDKFVEKIPASDNPF
ncbi:hypothetical protein CONLIGDRAFT_641625 [Coniochaeta ligniaria NRRL 30616]|uniref:Uncharacterized protein n=1 Tax=Coniochaeta ligniaria NRRL 30616 TaxID=1408157 RepID=A0A1J7IVV2_9PEZI|nr:hypothetical protein CONLIGDRAFT_641625 [Coniochaeta ligniaria NRRL 30616]